MEKPRILELKRIYDHRGNLSVVEEQKDLPFNIRRVYWLYDVPGGENRGGHAHKALYQFIISANGSFHVNLTDGKEKFSFFLNHPYRGVLVPPGYWRTLDDFSSGAVCLVLASEYFQEEDYIRDFQEFLKWRQHNRLQAGRNE